MPPFRRTTAPFIRSFTLLTVNHPPVLIEYGSSSRFATTRPSSKRGWFGSGRFRALQGVDFDVRRAQTLGVVGESGSGKSTLALALLGLHPHQGTLRLWQQGWGAGKDKDLSLRQRIQVVFQDPYSSLSPRMRIEEIVGEPDIFS